MDPDTTALIPPIRLGRLLRDHREQRGWSRVELATIHGIDVAELDSLEAGLRLLDDSALTIVSEVYGVDHGQIVPQRAELVIDVDEGTISAAGRTVDAGTSLGVELVLTRYLALVHTLRGVPVGTPVSLREVDVEVLAEALARPAGAIEADLHRMMAAPEAGLQQTARRVRASVVVPVAGLLVGITAIGGLVLVRSNDGSSVDDSGTPPAVGLTLPTGVEIGEAATLERAAVGPAPVTVEIGEPATIERPLGRVGAVANPEG